MRIIRIEGNEIEVGGETWYDPISKVQEFIEIHEYSGECPDLICLVSEDEYQKSQP